MKLIARLFVTAAALFAATRLVDGISYSGPPAGLLAVALVFGIVNAFVAPIVKLLSLPAIFLTLGLFLLVINALMLMLTAALSSRLGFAFGVNGLGPAVLGSIVVSVVSLLLRAFVSDNKDRD